jgi:hypothetical protein
VIAEGKLGPAHSLNFTTTPGETVTVTVFYGGSPTLGNIIQGGFTAVGVGDNATQLR